VAAVKQEAWHTRNAHLVGDTVFLTDKFPIHITNKVFKDFVSVLAMTHGNIGQKLMITDILTFKEVGDKQIFNQIIPHGRAFGADLGNQSMRIR